MLHPRGDHDPPMTPMTRAAQAQALPMVPGFNPMEGHQGVGGWDLDSGFGMKKWDVR